MRTQVLTLALILSLGAACQREKSQRGTQTPSAGAQEGVAAGVRHLNASSFDALMVESKPVLVDFWAPWCGPCRMQAPILEEVSTRLGETVIIGKVNVDDEKALAGRFNVQAIPTLILFKGGREVQRFVGVQQADALIRVLNAAQ